MKEKRFLPDGIAVTGVLVLLLALGVSAFVFRQDFSVWERRYLAKAPASFSLTDWTLNEDLEAFLSDQLPFRRQWVQLDSSVQVLTGRAVQLDAWPVGGAIVEKPVLADPEALLRRVDAFRTLAGEIPCRFLTPPTAGMMRMAQMSAPRRAVYAREAETYRTLVSREDFIPLEEDFRAATEEVFYRTDHHWTGYGAYLAYRACCRDAGLSPLEWTDFAVTGYAPFYGTTFSRSGLPFARADTLVCAEPRSPVTLRIQGEAETFDRLIFPEKAMTWDGYAVYLNGNHGLLTLENPSAPGGTLFVCRDSFASSLLPFLSAHYARIVAVDARYYPGTFREALEEAGKVDGILCVYSLDSLANDTSLPRKLPRD